ncbi:MAG: hypothetical protein FJ361_03235 [Gemmatimonadetes bacterium]|nr:hypothetical protein [Gemmatimonadota bacterium]
MAALGSLGFLLTACTEAAAPVEPPDIPWVRGLRDTPSFATDVQEIFDRRGCSLSGCHGAASTMPLTPGLAYDALVRVPARAEAAILVMPFDATQSYLMRRIDGTQNIGSRMPLGGAPLDSIDAANLRRWITQGARRN